MKSKLFLLIVILFIISGVLYLPAQDFGFNNEMDGGSLGLAPSFVPAVTIGGELSAGLTGYGDDFSDIGKTNLGDVLKGKLNFTVASTHADGTINLKLAPVFDGSASPLTIDEAYLRAYFGDFSLEGGLRKLTWGKADSFGPLDVVNPLDYSDLSLMGAVGDMKIARPMLHGSYQFGAFTKLEGVFIPTFQGHRFALEQGSRWAPSQFTDISSSFLSAILSKPEMGTGTAAIGKGMNDRMGRFLSNDMTKETQILSFLEYAQAGLRFTATIGSSDLGIQYFYGNLFRPGISIKGMSGFQNALSVAAAGEFQETAVKDAFDTLQIKVRYNRYHQAGIDYAQVLAGFNIRAEAAILLTDDLEGDKGDVYNPQLAWSLGFDRDLFLGINLNLQATETIRLFHDKLNGDPLLDIEAGKELSSTRLTTVLARKFLRDELEIKATGLWGIEDRDFLILPSIAWIKNDVTVELSGGLFGGDEQGELGQYGDNHFIKAVMGYKF
ncbi:conserved hypothetical protein [Treponema primitia ZAS-2]|uniref:Uncharacterized protein n=1 Tax=Treponema primitia (strain ATCC BAA-887 / DSM 12427 / ZAS-2) TaxID=545694 RepID=F5YHN9_TREPZ|nr:DUF1302 family protein [Treponema primitia]AEF84244.1 conserved hypothetical protein [Treponema primitia ZAS-2]